MSLLAMAQAHAASQPVESKQQLTRRLTIDVEKELGDLVEALETQFEGLELNLSSMDNAGRRPGGDEHSRMVPFAARVSDETGKKSAGQVTVYYTGSVTLTGVLTGLKWPTS